MSYESENMRLMGGVPGQQLFMYRSEDAAAAVSSVGYFDPATEEYNLDTGDVVIACTGAECCEAVGVFVASVEDGSVTMVAAA